MKNFKLCSFLVIVIVMLSITSCVSTRKWVTTPIYPEKVVSIMEVKEVIPEPATITQIREIIMFDYDSYIIKDDQISKIDKVESLMKKYSDTVIVLKGYASSEGLDEYNQQLSMDRAVAIKIALTEVGIEENRIKIIANGSTSIFGNLLNLNRRVIVLNIN